MHHFHWGHTKLWHVAKKKELNEIYVSMGIRSFALAIIGIFIPLYLFKELNFTLQQVMYFYLITLILFALFSIPAASLIKKIGAKHTILASIPILILFFILLYSLQSMPSIYLLTAAVGGIADAFFWIAFHLNFIKSSDHKKRGKEVGIFFAVSMIAGILGPLIGGSILSFLDGFTVLFIAVSILLILSTVPLFMSQDKGKKSNFKIKNIFKALKPKEFISLTALGLRSYAAGILWPIFIFVILKTYFNLGSLTSVIGLFAAILVIYSGKLSDKYGKKPLILTGSYISGIVWFFRIFIKTVSHVFWTAIIGDLSFSANDVALSAEIYDRAAKNKNKLEFLIAREWALCTGRAILAISIILTSKYAVGFVLAGISSFVWTII